MDASNMIFRLDLGKHTAPGINRTQNEDNIGYYFSQQSEVLLLRGQMFMVADGNDSESLGEFGSKLVVQTVIQEYYEEPWVGTVEEMLAKSLMKANRALIDANIENRSTSRFSTSLTCGVIHQEHLYLAHVGTCRAFLLSNNIFEILTQSHSFDVERNGREFDLEGEENGKVLVRALGIDEDVKIDLIERKLQINDIILLCTDGIYDYVNEREIQSIITAVAPQQACELIVKQALANESPDDATAIMIKVKSIKRIEADEAPLTPTIETAEPAERQIVIKGVRYRSIWNEGQLPASDKESVAEFSQDREVRRPIPRRSTTHDRRQYFPLRQFLNILTIVAFIGLLAFLGIKYIPKYWQARKQFSESTAITDTFTPADRSKQPSVEQKKAPEIIQTTPPDLEGIEDTREFGFDEQPAMPGESKLEVVIIDGSFKANLTWNNFIKDMKIFSNADQINHVQSSLRLQKSKILWRRSANVEKETIIKQRADQYQKLFSRYFKITPELSPLDLTLVIGANFELPRLETGFLSASAGSNVDYYLEILNGFTIPGLAKRLSEQLNQRKINDKRIVVVDFRNADRKNYRVSFIKCDPSLNNFSKELGSLLKQKFSVVNTQLFDIKLIVGTDIQF